MMKQKRNVAIWAGFLVIVLAFVTYLLVFIRIPATRDLPWPTLLILAVGLALLIQGLIRAWRLPQVYRGRISGSIVAALSAGLIAIFVFSVFVAARWLPASSAAPRVGQAAPDFTLPDQDGNDVT